REVTTDTVAALLTILGYSLYDTIIVFDRVRENVPRMPRAAFSQIVNRSMSEVLTRSIATTSCTLLPVIALLLFGGSTLKDFAFALLIGVASGAYSSIFIASPVLTHWKEREPGYRHRRQRILEEFGAVPAYATGATDIEPTAKKTGRTGRLTTPEGDTVSAAEFEAMKRDLALEDVGGSRHTSALTKRLAHTAEEEERRTRSTAKAKTEPPARKPAPRVPKPAPPAAPDPAAPEDSAEIVDGDANGSEHVSAPDVAENEGMMPVQKPGVPPKSKARNRRHGRRR
ncbi:MAG: protein translocase subunit SecF, partial [Actinomycetota bacterium]|nr:protein translocase subunit SecF [Actinomycetota bacterium]